jgi:PAS domain-containing protein
VFELLDDYMVAPGAAFFACDSDGKVLGLGRGAFELTGLSDEDVIGRSVKEVLGLEWRDAEQGLNPGGPDSGSDPVDTTLEWGVRSLGKKVKVRAEGDLPTEAVADLFPAYDDDGGLLLVLTPESG